MSSPVAHSRLACWGCPPATKAPATIRVWSGTSYRTVELWRSIPHTGNWSAGDPQIVALKSELKSSGCCDLVYMDGH
ncbi:Pisatin demethylase [Fusarium oxysporum f. sp. albedinis]|nr:Pisatin demethylase [Fusarium oxysporum f. sp. albedinis]